MTQPPAAKIPITIPRSAIALARQTLSEWTAVKAATIIGESEDEIGLILLLYADQGSGLLDREELKRRLARLQGRVGMCDEWLLNPGQFGPFLGR